MPKTLNTLSISSHSSIYKIKIKQKIRHLRYRTSMTVSGHIKNSNSDLRPKAGVFFAVFFRGRTRRRSDLGSSLILKQKGEFQGI
jgi:hypothetical protein